MRRRACVSPNGSMHRPVGVPRAALRASASRFRFSIRPSTRTCVSPKPHSRFSALNSRLGAHRASAEPSDCEPHRPRCPFLMPSLNAVLSARTAFAPHSEPACSAGLLSEAERRSQARYGRATPGRSTLWRPSDSGQPAHGREGDQSLALTYRPPEAGSFRWTSRTAVYPVVAAWCTSRG